MSAPGRSHAMDHVILVLFENRSLDNMLGQLYGPDSGKTFEGILGKDLSNPVPAWAEHQPPDGSGVVKAHVGTNLDAPCPDSGEEWFHTNTQVFGVMDEANRFHSGPDIQPPWNTPPEGANPTMQGFVEDYISFFTWEMGRQPTYDEYKQIMQCYAPEQVPVLNGIARQFGVFDHWFSEVPSQTFPNRSFWTAATCTPLPTGGTINDPSSHFINDNAAETIFNRLEAHGRSWKVYIKEPATVSFTGVIHWQRLHDRFPTNFVPFEEFKKDAANGALPDFSFIEPNLCLGHGDYHPAAGMALFKGYDLPLDPPSSILSGEAFLDELFETYKAMTSPTGSNVWNTTLFIGWDEPGGTFDHVHPGAVPPPDPSAPAGQFGFTFDRSGYRVPAVVVSPWVEPGSVHNAEHRHTSMIATLRKVWDLGDPFTQRDAHAAPFDYVFSREVPTDPEDWEVPRATPLTPPQIDYVKADQTLSTLGKAILPGIIAKAKQKGVALPPQVEDPNFHLTPQLASDTITYVGTHFWPLLGPQGPALDDLKKKISADLDAATKPLSTDSGS
jgi:phospholipase C